MREPLSEPTESTAPTPPADAAKIARLHHKARRLRRLNQLRWASTKIALTICLIRAARVAFGIAFHLPLWTIVLAVLCITPAIFDKKLKADWRKTIHALTEVGDAQAVGPLIEGLEITEERGFAREMLAVVLPRLKANDAPLLTPRHHRILNRQLSSKSVSIGIWRRAFTLATLNAYEQVGGTDDLPTVQRLANGEGYAKRNKDIRKAAQECLPFLQARSEQQDARQTLLRASHSAADSIATLLRPAAASDELAPRQLLRSVEPKE